MTDCEELYYSTPEFNKYFGVSNGATLRRNAINKCRPQKRGIRNSNSRKLMGVKNGNFEGFKKTDY